jgi:hypothetical protein
LQNLEKLQNRRRHKLDRWHGLKRKQETACRSTFGFEHGAALRRVGAVLRRQLGLFLALCGIIVVCPQGTSRRPPRRQPTAHDTDTTRSTRAQAIQSGSGTQTDLGRLAQKNILRHAVVSHRSYGMFGFS